MNKSARYLLLLLLISVAAQAEDSASYFVDLGFSVGMNIGLRIERPALNAKELFFELNATSPLFDRLLRYGRITCSSSFKRKRERVGYDAVEHSCEALNGSYNLNVKYQNNVVDTMYAKNITRSSGRNFAIFRQSKDFLTAFLAIAENVSLGLSPGNWQILGADGVNFYGCKYCNDDIKIFDKAEVARYTGNNPGAAGRLRSILCVCRRVADFPEGRIISGDCGSVKMDFDSDFFPLSILWSWEGNNWRLKKQAS